SPPISRSATAGSLNCTKSLSMERDFGRSRITVDSHPSRNSRRMGRLWSSAPIKMPKSVMNLTSLPPLGPDTEFRQAKLWRSRKIEYEVFCNQAATADALVFTMTKKLLFVTTILLVVALGAFAADVTGKWTYEAPGRGGGQGMSQTITLKADGDKLTGSVPGFGRGGQAPPTEITNGKVTGDKVY